MMTFGCLLVLDICDLVGVLTGSHKLTFALQARGSIFDPHEEVLQLGERPLGAEHERLLGTGVATANRAPGVVAMTATATVQGVGVSRGLPVAKVWAVTASANAPGHPGLFNGFADHNTVLLELLGQDGIEKRVAAAVERQDENGEDLGLLQVNQVEPTTGSQGKESNGCPANKIGENQ
jgi:hypothetical protein